MTANYNKFDQCLTAEIQGDLRDSKLFSKHPGYYGIYFSAAKIENNF
jgi:hypothetical protein